MYTCVPKGCGMVARDRLLALGQHEVIIIDSVGGLNRTLYVFLRGICTLTILYLPEYQISVLHPHWKCQGVKLL